MREYSKKTKKLLRELAGQAYEEELKRALVPLSESFDQWKKHHISSGELSDLIHDFNRGPARDLLVKGKVYGVDPTVCLRIKLRLGRQDAKDAKKGGNRGGLPTGARV